MNTSPIRMNYLFQLLAMVLFASYLASCRAPFRQNFVGSAQQCGLAPGQVSDEEIVVQLLNPEGQPLTRDQARSLSSRMMLTDGQTQDLNVTPGGCLRLPSDQGTLQVYHAHAGWSYAGILQQRAQKPRFQQVRMVKNSSIQAFLQCPTQGFFSDDRLAFPLLWNSTGSLDAAQFQLIAEDLSNKKRYELYKKPYGETPAENPGFLATGILPEGVYDLRFRFLLAQSAWDQAPVLPVDHERCRLTVLHGPVHVTGLEDYPLHHGVGIFEQGSIIPLKSSRTEGQLRVCKEKRDWDRATDESGAVDCQPRHQCLDPENFQPTAQVLADEVGIFDYFSEVRMPSGQVSSPRLCRTVLVSSSRPRLQVTWDNPRWGEELAVMDKPVSELSLNISRILNEQPRVLDDKLEGRLQCKAEFVYANQTIRPGRVFTCNAGACQGQSLETFKNCSEELKINILPIWSSLTSDGGHVRIHVRYDTGRNHIEEQSVAIGIKPRKWQPRELKTGDENFESGVALFKNRAGQIFSLSTTKGVLQWDETKFGVTDLKRPGSWQRMPPIRSGQKQDAATRIWQDRDGELVVQETYEVAGSPSLLTVIARWTADGWKELAWPADLKDPQCQQPQPGKRTVFWCRGVGPELIIERGDRLVALPLPDHAEIAACLSSNSLHISENFQGNFAVACASAVWQEQAGLWSKLELPQ
ncbi:MAG: hypothetical protein M3Q07_03070, partial [Pseudobdellovibrionaceae bacterium]|nr:hypothetical protein [Pseudobdellovibrionaceae bacterium]